MSSGLDPNALGETLEPGRVPDCYLGLLLADDVQGFGVLIVSPAALLHPAVPQPDGTVLYELATGHPDRASQELVFLADLTVELRAWPTDTWAKVGVDPQAAARAVVAGWQHGDLPGVRLGGLSAEEALALERPAMTYVREQLRQRLAWQVGQAYWRWLHPTSGRRPGDRFLSSLERTPAVADAAGCWQLSGAPDSHPGRQRRNRPGCPPLVPLLSAPGRGGRSG